MITSTWNVVSLNGDKGSLDLEDLVEKKEKCKVLQLVLIMIACWEYFGFTKIKLFN